MKPLQTSLSLKKCKLFFFFCLIFSIKSYAQLDKKEILKEYKHFSEYNVGSTSFLVYKKDDHTKPTIIFITGSGFNPLFINGNFYGIPFDFYRYADNYNFVVIQKPGIPVFDDSTQNKYLNQSFPTGFYLDSSGIYPPEFVKKNDKSYYVNQHKEIIQFLTKQVWVQKGKIILIGHSQGALVASAIAMKNKMVDKVVLMSPGSIFTRFHEFIRTIRRDELYNLISHQAAQQKVDSIYAKYQDLLQFKNDAEKKYDPFSYKSYYSFEQPKFIETVLAIKQKALIIYGTSSIQDLDCDYIPFYLSEADKNSIKVIAYPGYDHNYFENMFDSKGAFVEQKFHWDDVMKDVMEWISNK